VTIKLFQLDFNPWEPEPENSKAGETGDSHPASDSSLN